MIIIENRKKTIDIYYFNYKLKKKIDIGYDISDWKTQKKQELRNWKKNKIILSVS